MNGANIEMCLLGRFAVVVDGARVPDDSWSRRHAMTLVKLLALAPGRRLHREQVIDRLWPDDLVATAAPKLHKATHFARRALGRDDAIVLAGDTIALFPHAAVRIDAVDFERDAVVALDGADDDATRRALDRYHGELLPDDPYAEWAVETREHLAVLHRALLRRAGRWTALLALDPIDEEAHLALIREHVARGRRASALRQFERLERALHRELGVAPSAEATQLRADVLGGVQRPRPCRRRLGHHTRHTWVSPR